MTTLETADKYFERAVSADENHNGNLADHYTMRAILHYVRYIAHGPEAAQGETPLAEMAKNWVGEL